jgi:hypothetical protein
MPHDCIPALPIVSIAPRARREHILGVNIQNAWPARKW